MLPNGRNQTLPVPKWATVRHDIVESIPLPREVQVCDPLFEAVEQGLTYDQPKN